MKSAIGVFGGTFNPVHAGHIEVAKAALKECNLSKVIFLPNGNPPHKQGEIIAPSHHRYNMIKLAIDGIDSFEVSDYELKRQEPSYTIDTNRVFKTMYDCPVFFIIGADSLHTLSTWRNYDALIHECSFIVAPRDDSDFEKLCAECDMHNLKGGKAIPLKMNLYDAKSTDIRHAVNQNDITEFLLPQKVASYIKKHNLY